MIGLLLMIWTFSGELVQVAGEKVCTQEERFDSPSAKHCSEK